MRVLVVEHEPALAAAIARSLLDEGFAVDLAADGRSGLLAATERPYGAVVLDLVVPQLSGDRLLQQLRATHIWTPVLVLLDEASQSHIVEVLDLGADSCLAKPVSHCVLGAQLRALVRRHAAPRPSTIAAGDLVLHPAAHRCHRGTVEVALTPREFSLLECLLRQPDTVVSKTEILGHVWDESFGGDPNIVEVCISGLRRKIDLPFRRHAIETVRGAGYRLRGDGG